MKEKNNTKAYIFVIITAMLFASMEVACKIAGNNLDPFQLTFLRFVVGGVIILPFALIELRKNKVKLCLRDFYRLAGVGTLGIPISMVFFQLGIINCNASTASVMISINPIFTMVCAHLFTNEKMTKERGIAFAFAMIGLLFMIKPWNLQDGNTVFGIICMLVAAVTFGAYTVAGKVSVQKMGIMAQTSISFLIGAFVLLLVILVLDKPVLAGVSEGLPLVLYLGIFVTGIGYLTYFMSMKLADAATGSFAFFLKPAIAPVIAVIVLGETILWNTYVGIGFILLASYLNIRFQKMQAKEKRIANEREEKS